MSRIEVSDNYVQRDGALLDVNFVAATVSGGTGASSTAYVKNTAAALKVVPSTSYCEVKKTLTTPIVLGNGRVLGLWVYLKNGDPNTSPTGIPYLNLVFSDAAGYYTNTRKVGFAGYHLKWNQWNYLNIHTGDDGKWFASGTPWSTTGSGSASMTVTGVNVVLGAMDGQGIEVYIDSVEIDQRSRPKILFGFDAVSSNLTTSVLPLLQAAGLTGYVTFNGNAGVITTSIPLAQQWRDAGWEVMNHGYTHTPIGTMTDDASIIAEVEQNWDAMVANDLVVPGQVKGWLGPENSSSPRAKRVLDSLGYKFARNYKQLTTKTTRHGVDNLLDMGSYDLGNPSSLSRVLNLLDAAPAYGGTIWFFVHEVNITSPATGSTGDNGKIYIDDLTAFINKMVAMRDKGLADFPKPSEWYKGLTDPRVLA